MLTISQLLSTLTPDQVVEQLTSIMVTLGVPADKWRKAGSFSTLRRAVATMYAGFTSTMVIWIKAGFLETAEGAQLTALAFYVFNVVRPVATFATGTVELTNTGGGIYTKTIGEAVFLNSTTGKSYTNAANFTITPGDIGIPVDVVAAEVGTASNADPGQIDEISTAMLGVTVTNAAAVVGQDEMADADLRLLCQNKMGTLSNGGPRKAYLFAVQSALRLDGTPVNINRVLVSPDSSVGVVTIYVAAPSGAPLAADVTAVRASIEALARPDAVTATTIACTGVPVTRAITVWSDGSSGLTAAELATKAETAIVDALTSYPIAGRTKPPSLQGYLFADFVRSLAERSDPSIYHVEDGGAPDQPLDAGEVAVMAITVTAIIVAPS